MSTETIPSLSRRQAWILASRPKTLPAAAAPVILGAAAAYYDHVFRLWPALAALAVALLLQIGANISNDYFDFKKGADTHERVGPTRVTQAGLLAEREIIAGMAVVFGLAALCGLYLIFQVGWPALVIGALAILAALAYTGGPYPLGYHGLGEVFVFIFFGLAAVAGTYYVQAGHVSALAWWAAIPPGLLSTGILTINNLRDRETDLVSGKRTLAVRLGEKGALREYALCLGLAYLFCLPPILLGAAPWFILLTLLSAPLAVRLAQKAARLRGRPLNQVLAQTGQLELIFCLLYALGLLLV
jgi:1,4-dihydroxy-2-naphthoate octaprenyltransferase